MTGSLGQKSNPTTVRLLARFKSGDQEALNELYKRYFDRMLAVVRLRMGPVLRTKLEDVDIVQEAFMASLKGLESFAYRTEGDFFHWLCSVTENRIRDLADYFGAAKRNIAKETPLQPVRPSAKSVFGPINDLATFTSPATKVAKAEEIHRLEQAIDTLPERQREALLLVRYEHLTFAEAALSMGKSPQAVKMLVARAIIALGKSLGVVSPKSG